MRRIVLLLPVCAALVAADVVVPRDRRILEGKAEKTGEAVRVGTETVRLDEVLLWEGDDGVARHPTPLRAHLQALGELADARTRAACLERLPTAIEKNARDTALALLARAEQAGLDPEDAEAWQTAIGKLEGGGTADVKVPGREILAGLLVDRARKALDADQEMRGWELLREALRLDDKHEGARDLLDEVAPARWRVGDPTKGDDIQRIWLDWHIDVIQPGMRAVGRRQPDIQRAKRTWRDQLHGCQTQEIVFITPLTESRIVGMCTKYAWITCQALEKMFHTESRKREDNLPLVIYMYPDRDDYNRNGGRIMGGPVQMTLGFYVPGENISRFFWPGKQASAEWRVRNTFVHELTHHWIERRNPRWHARDLADMGERVQTPGYWIVEGFATFIQEGRYDIATNTWTHFNPKANSIDITAALAKDGKLIKWEKVYRLTQAQFHGGGVNKSALHAQVNKKWSLYPSGITEIRLFYEQSATTCHCLYWLENGKYREALLDYVTSFYTSRRAETSIEKAFGLTEEELGKKVEAWARAVMDGWRPE